jgi:hypothetical protein
VYRRDARFVVLTSDLYLLAALPSLRLELDPVSVEELGRIGHPTGHRTLFKHTELIPSGSYLCVSSQTGEKIESLWRFQEASPVGWDRFIERQIAAFADAMRRIDVSDSFLSLTAGLDSRTVFALLADQGRLVPGVTMSGVRPSLDARTAATLCRAYGVRHEVVRFDEEFTRALPGYVEQGSRLSGGLETLEQAPEVYFYDQLKGEFGARLSGNLGNQVGRGGTGGVGVRGADVEILSRSVLADSTRQDDSHWLLGQLENGWPAALSFILQQELPFSSVGNFTVGSHFAIQQSPYASRALIETLPLKPGGRSAPSGSMIRMRLRDLNHRFLGEPASISFQRSLLRKIGGFAARYPINYGWRASGGVSPAGLILGTATLLGMVAQKMGWETGLASLHDFRRSSHWLREDLAEFTRDILGSRIVREAGLFDTSRLDQILDDHFSGKQDHHDTVTFAVDVALAHRLFCFGG